MKALNKIPVTGAVLLVKPKGITSFQVLSSLKRNLGTRRVGHTGTLDKFASGLLVVLVGCFTRLNSYLAILDKEYNAIIRFGEATETLDPEGSIIKTGRIPSWEEIEKILPYFRGRIDQCPPLFSSIHIGGRRAYKRALNRESFIIPSRPVTIHSLDVLSYEKRELRVRIYCSKGTYIRSLARDIAQSLGTVAYVSYLERTKVGQFCLEDGIDAGEVSVDTLISPEYFLKNLGIRIEKVNDPIPFLVGKDLEILLKKEGISFEEEGKLALVTVNGVFLALIKKEGRRFFYIFAAEFS